MSSFRQIEANRRNARLSTGPVTEEGKNRSRQNALRHGLTAETVIDMVEDAEDYAAFQTSVTADYDPQSAVERELILRLASLLWRLRRASAVETGLFKAQARQLLQFQQRRQRTRHEIVDGLYQRGVASKDEIRHEQDEELFCEAGPHSPSCVEVEDPSDSLTRSFLRLNNMPTCPLDRLSRYEASLWRQTCQILFTLQCLNRPRTWAKSKHLLYR